MRKRFEMMEVMRALGIAPSTASVIANLMNGTLDPDNFRSVEVWALSDLEAPPQYRKVLAAIAELLELDMEDVRVTMDKDGQEMWYLAGVTGQPTVAWHDGKFMLMELEM